MKLLLPILAFVLTFPVSAQVVIDTLDHNNTSALIPVKGYFFYDEVNQTGGYEVPKASGDNFIYNLKFNYMAKDQNGVLHASLGQGPSGSGTDVWSGPYSTLGTFDTSYDDKYWEICQDEVDIYTTWWEACQGPNANPTDCSDAEIPSNELLDKIYAWPAHGDVNGEDYWLLDFYDHPESQMGVFDPEGGDYPLFKGCCATFLIQNDGRGVHTYSGAEPIGIQVEYQFFQYASWGDLNDVTFVEFTLKNHSTNDYTDFSYGVYADTDLGDGLDDYFGSDSSRSLFYTYNGSNIDALHGSDPAAFGIMALEHPANSIVLFDHNGTSVSEWWNQLNGLQVSGQDYLNAQNQPTKFLYSDNPNLANSWSEEELGNPSGDRSAIIGTHHGPLAAGEEITQTYAILYNRVGTRLENVDGLLAMADGINNFYDTIANAQCENGVLNLTSISEVEDLIVYPNPAANSVEFSFEGSSAELLCYDMLGNLVYQKGLSSGDKLDVSSWSNGVYLIHVVSDNQNQVARLEVLH